jgi:6-phospho-beta-glucosidase
MEPDVRRPVIAIVGGGVYVPRLCALVAAALPSAGTLRLYARRPKRVARIAAAAHARVTGGWSVVATSELGACVDGADAVVLLVRVGGLAARAHDEQFPTALGLVGDEGLGPGGFANAFRSAPVLAAMAATLRRHCPRALVCNLVAPLGITTRLFLDEGLDAVGICELPTVTLERLAGGSDVDFDYVGLNHLGWFWNVRQGGRDLLDAAVARGLVDAPTLARFGAAPLGYYYEVFDRAAGRRLGLERRPGRAHTLAQLADEGFAALDDANADPEVLAQRPTPWFDRALVPLLAAHAGGAPYDGFLDVANGALVPALPPAAVVELPARVAATRSLRAPAACPPAVARFLAAVAAAEALAYAAARAGDAALLAHALSALPLPISAAQLPALVAAALAPPSPLEAAP